MSGQKYYLPVLLRIRAVESKECTVVDNVPEFRVKLICDGQLHVGSLTFSNSLEELALVILGEKY